MTDTIPATITKKLTYWGVSVSVNGVVKMSTGSDTLADALRRGISDAIYYQAIYPAGKVVIGGIVETCGMCWNEGEIERRPGVWAKKKCPMCKGKIPTGTVGDIVFEMPDAANRIRLVSDA